MPSISLPSFSGANDATVKLGVTTAVVLAIWWLPRTLKKKTGRRMSSFVRKFSQSHRRDTQTSVRRRNELEEADGMLWSAMTESELMEAVEGYIGNISESEEGGRRGSVSALASAVTKKKLDRMNHALFERLKHFKFLLEITQKLTNEYTHASATDTAIQGCYIVGCERVSMFLVDHDEKVLRMVKSQDAQAVELPFGQGLAGYVAQTGCTINVDSVYKDSRFNPEVDKETGFTTRNMVCIPVKDCDSEEVLAVLQVINKVDGVFTRADVELLECLAAIAGNTLRQTALYQQSLHATKQMETLLAAVTSISISLNKGNINDLIHTIVEQVYNLLECERVSLLLVDEVKEELWCGISQDAGGIRIPIGFGIAGHCARTAELIHVEDAYDDPRFDPSVDKTTGFKTRSILCVPVRRVETRVSRYPIAVIQAINKKGHGGKFSKKDQDLLAGFSAEVGVALERKSLECSYLKVLEDSPFSGDNIESSFLALWSPQGKTMLTTSVIKNVVIETPELWPSKSDSPDLYRWDLDVWKQGDALLGYVQEIFKSYDLLERFRIDEDTFRNFVLEVRANYHSRNAFHNFYHGFSVCHVAFLMLQNTNAPTFLTQVDILGLFIAALCHDVDHPGHTNLFEVNANSTLATLYNDQAVLENHHASTTFRLIRKKENNILANLTAEEKREIRSVIINGILSTDMSQHVDHCSKLKSTSKPAQFLAKEASQRQFLVDTIIHSADLSGQALPPSVAQQWGERVLQEFEEQSSSEESLGLEPTPFMRGLSDPLVRAKMQVNFINYVVRPLWTPVAELFPDLKHCVDNLERNRDIYQKTLGYECRSNSVS